MNISIKVMAGLVFASVLLASGPGRRAAAVPDAPSPEVARLAEVINDPIAQRDSPAEVLAAISALGDLGGPDGVGALAANIAYPFVLADLPPGATAIDDAGALIEMGMFGPDGRLNKRAFPAVKALVRIGDVCIPDVLHKLVVADYADERNACLDVLVELRGHDVVEAMLRNELDSAASDETRRRIMYSLEMLPSIQVVDPEPGFDTVSPGLIDGRRKLVRQRKIGLPPMIVVGNQAVPRAGKLADGAVLVPLTPLAKLLSVDVKPGAGAGKLILSAKCPEPRVLAVACGARDESVGGRHPGTHVPSFLRGGETLVPLRAVAEYFGADVTWDPQARVAWVRT